MRGNGSGPTTSDPHWTAFTLWTTKRNSQERYCNLDDFTCSLFYSVLRENYFKNLTIKRFYLLPSKFKLLKSQPSYGDKHELKPSSHGVVFCLCLSVRLSICFCSVGMSITFSVCLSVCLSVSVSLSVSVCLSPCILIFKPSLQKTHGFYSIFDWLQYFPGNSDQNTEVSHSLSPHIRARYIRVVPWTWYSVIAMRVEFYGCITGKN